MKPTDDALPTLEGARLTLRPFDLDDAERVRELAGAPEVALTTQNIPHPYGEEVAEDWIATHGPNWTAGNLLTLAIDSETDGLVGAVSLHINAAHRRGELGYWVGQPYWNRGYATEAARALLEFGFRELSLNRIQARHFTRNPSSGRVMQKLGMSPEGVHRQHIFVRGGFEDTAMYAILGSEFEREP